MFLVINYKYDVNIKKNNKKETILEKKVLDDCLINTSV